MDEIIREIINIDQEANRKLEEANRMRDDVLKNQIVEENKELKKKMRERATMHLTRVRETEQKRADEKIAVIKNRKENELAAMKKVYEANHQAWEDSMVDRVLGRCK